MLTLGKLCTFVALQTFSAHTPDRTPLSEMSPSYQRVWKKRYMDSRIEECKRLVRFAKNQPGLSDNSRLDVKRHEILWILSTAVVESGLNNSVVSKRGAKSSMQTYRKYAPCKTCDLRVAGIYHAITYQRKHGSCSAAAKYNAGPRGTCMGLGRGYASLVLSVYEDVCAEDGTECPIDWGC